MIGSSPPADRRGRAPRPWLVPLVIAAVTFLVFLPALRNGFVTWDDDLNFLDNHHYRGLGWEQLEWMWTSFHLGHYIPISWMTLGLDYVLWGMNPAGYHLTNLVLHTINAVLLYHFARRILRHAPAFECDSRGVTTAAAFTALLFAIHPLRVESVAWVTERRDVLSLLFFLLCLQFYLRSAEGPAPGRGKWYWLAIAMFLFALLSKATVMTLPAVLLIMNARLKRLGGTPGWWTTSARRVYLEVLPFAVPAAATALMSLVALQPPDQLKAAEKVAVSAYSLAFYLWKTVWPVGLSPLYELPTTIDPFATPFLLSYAVVVGVTALAVALRRRLPDVTIAWLVFVAILLPMLGAVTNGPQIAADRYTYHAAPVLAILAAALLALLQRRVPRLPLTVGALTLAALGVLTWRQTGVWRDSWTLWSHVVRIDPASSMGHAGLGSIYMVQDRVTEALSHYERSVALDPLFEEGHNNLGVALARQGRVDDAIAQYEQALAIRPNYAQARNNWGIALAMKGDLAGATEQYRQAVALDPRLADAHTNWGNALVRMGYPGDAIPHYEQAARTRPDQPDTQLNWGVALIQQGNIESAIAHFERALAIQPDHAEAREYLARAAALRQP